LPRSAARGDATSFAMVCDQPYGCGFAAPVLTFYLSAHLDGVTSGWFARIVASATLPLGARARNHRLTAKSFYISASRRRLSPAGVCAYVCCTAAWYASSPALDVGWRRFRYIAPCSALGVASERATWIRFALRLSSPLHAAVDAHSSLPSFREPGILGVRLVRTRAAHKQVRTAAAARQNQAARTRRPGRRRRRRSVLCSSFRTREEELTDVEESDKLNALSHP